MSVTEARTGRDQRKHVRAACQLPVRFRLKGGSVVTEGLPPVSAVTRDISEGGLFVDLGDTRVAPGQSLTAESFLLLKSTMDIEIDPRDGGPRIVVVGKAVWVERPVQGQDFRHGIAVQFMTIMPDDRHRIASLVAGASSRS